MFGGWCEVGLTGLETRPTERGGAKNDSTLWGDQRVEACGNLFSNGLGDLFFRDELVSGKNSGERTRTSDPRLMNPQADSHNAGTANDFGQGVIAGYTPGYTGNANRDSKSISDPDLLRLIELWPILPEHVRKTILTLLETAR